MEEKLYVEEVIAEYDMNGKLLENPPRQKRTVASKPPVKIGDIKIMANYLVVMKYSGVHELVKYVLPGVQSDEDALKMVYLAYFGYGELADDSLEEMVENYCAENEVVKFNKSKRAMIDEMESEEDIVEFIFNCDTLKTVYEYSY